MQIWESIPVWVIKWNIQKRAWSLKWPRAAKILAELTYMTADMRNDIAWTAITESEERFLSWLIPDIWERWDSFIVKLESMRDTPLERVNSQRIWVFMPQLNVEQLIDPTKKIDLYAPQWNEIQDIDYEEAF